MNSETDIVELYQKLNSIKAVAKEVGISTHTVRKILISNRVRCSSRQETVEELLTNGKSVTQIADMLGVTEKTVKQYIPYTRHSYAVGEKSENAKRIEKCRKNKQTK